MSTVAWVSRMLPQSWTSPAIAPLSSSIIEPVAVLGMSW